MAKADLEHAKVAYDEAMARAHLARDSGKYTEAVSCAVRAWDYVEDMMRFERKYEKTEFVSLSCIDLVLQFAPLVIHADSIERLRALLRERRALERNTSADLGAKLTDASEMLRLAHRLWDCVERNPGVRQDELQERLGAFQALWRSLAEKWEAMGAIRRIPDGASYQLRLATNLDDRVKAKCSKCGVVVVGAKVRFLDVVDCPSCGKNAAFVMLENAIEYVDGGKG